MLSHFRANGRQVQLLAADRRSRTNFQNSRRMTPRGSNKIKVLCTLSVGLPPMPWQTPAKSPCAGADESAKPLAPACANHRQTQAAIALIAFGAASIFAPLSALADPPEIQAKLVPDRLKEVLFAGTQRPWSAAPRQRSKDDCYCTLPRTDSSEGW